MATQADYLRVLKQSGPMPITHLMNQIYPGCRQGCSCWSLDRLVAKGQVRVVRLGWAKEDRDPMNRRAKAWVMLKADCERLLDQGVIKKVEIHNAYTNSFWVTRYTLVPGRSFSACTLCGGHETEGLHHHKQFGIVHRECKKERI